MMTSVQFWLGVHQGKKIMIIDTVTMTGADDSIAPHDLISLTRKYPFVEWGILLSKNAVGTNRFPSQNWQLNLQSLSPLQGYLSGHLCGTWVRDLAIGKITVPKSVIKPFTRVQLNFHAQKMSFNDNFLNCLKYLSVEEIIFQYDGVNTDIAHDAHKELVAAALFDISHGAGESPKEWLKPLPDMYCGYAGGLGPDNLEEELKRIEAVVGYEHIWIDMETKVRSDDDRQFDLDKVAKCLEIAKQYTESK